MKIKTKLVFGWGINDVDYNVYKYHYVEGKRKVLWICPYYQDWKSMLRRCLYHKSLKVNPTYKGCSIHEEWKYLSNFIKWVDSQPNRDWQNCSLDKDFLYEGNKHYSPDNCVYIPANVNCFINLPTRSECTLLLGVHRNLRGKPYQARCNNMFINKSDYLGVFDTELEAHKAWQAKKHELACQLADLQDDPRVAKRLREIYSPETDWTNR